MSVRLYIPRFLVEECDVPSRRYTRSLYKFACPLPKLRSRRRHWECCEEYFMNVYRHQVYDSLHCVALLITKGSDLCNDSRLRKLHGNICFLLHDNVAQRTRTPLSFPGPIGVPITPITTKRQVPVTTSPPHLFPLLQVAPQISDCLPDLVVI